MVAILLTLAGQLAALRLPFSNEHGWNDALYAMMGRSFAIHGVRATHAVPIRNNGALGSEPDVYLHWPPLFPVVLGAAFRLWGVSEAVARSIVLAAAAVACVLLFRLVLSLAGTVSALLSALAFLAMPATALYARQVVFLQLGWVACLAAALASARASATPENARRHRLAACAALFVGVWFSWDVVFFGCGVLVVGILTRDRAARREGALYLLAGALGALSVLALYVLSHPRLAEDLWKTALMRSGLARFDARTSIYTLADEVIYRTPYPQQPLVKRLWALLLALFDQGQVPAAAALALPFVRRMPSVPRSALTIGGGLAGPFVGWFLLMPNQAWHSYMRLLIVPIAAYAVGVVGGAVLGALASDLGQRTSHAAGWSALLLSTVLLFGLVKETNRRRALPGDSAEIAEGRELRARTEPDAVILTPEVSQLSMFYSDRHTIRGVLDDDSARRVAGRVRELFPSAPIYLVLPGRDSSDSFRRTIGDAPPEVTTPHARIWRLPRPASAPGSGAAQPSGAPNLRS